MAFAKPQINHISTDIQDLTIYLRTTKKWGKSTLFRNVILSKYGDPSYGLSVSCGKEKGEKMLDNLNVTRIKTYQDAIELKNWLIKEKGKEHNIKIISFDTVDELVPIFEKETIRLSNIENPTKKTKTINGAMGGYQAGQGYTANDLIKPYMDELQEAGFGIWAISHTKFKTIKEKGGLEEDGYMQLTSNLVSAYESAFGDVFDVTLTGIIDRDVETKEVKDGDKTKLKRYSTNSIRKLYFRETPLIDAGGRFAFGAVPEYMVFDKGDMSEEFIKTVEDGMEKSKTLGTPIKKTKKIITKSEPQIEDEVIEEKQVVEDTEDDVDTVEESEDLFQDEDNVEDVNAEDLVIEIRSIFKSASKEQKEQIKELVAPVGGKLNADVPIDVLQEVLEVLK